MSNTNRAVALQNAIIPRAPRIPSDLTVLESRCPMSMTLATLRGGESRVQAAADLGAKLHIAALIADSLASGGRA